MLLVVIQVSKRPEFNFILLGTVWFNGGEGKDFKGREGRENKFFFIWFVRGGENKTK